MKLKVADAARVLTTFIQEDRTEARIWREKVHSVTSSIVVASFAISAFLIGRVTVMGVGRFRNITLVIDIGLALLMVVFFCRVKVDLTGLRKAMKARQDLLKGLREGEETDIDPFPWGEELDVEDDDLYWVVGLCFGIVLTKMIVLAIGAGSFVVAKGL